VAGTSYSAQLKKYLAYANWVTSDTKTILVSRLYLPPSNPQLSRRRIWPTLGDFKVGVEVSTPVFSVHFVQQTQTLTPTSKSPIIYTPIIYTLCIYISGYNLIHPLYILK
jgi:hypothetical protein